MVKWDLMDGVKLVQAIQQDCRVFGYHVTLGGGVLNNGVARKDVDLYFLPLKDARQGADARKLLTWLTGLWGPSESIANYGTEVAMPSNTSNSNAFISDEVVPYTPPPANQGEDIYFSGTIPSTYGNLTRSTSTPLWRTRTMASSATGLFSTGSLASLIDNARPSIPEPSVGTVYQYKEKFLRKTSKDRIDVFIV